MILFQSLTFDILYATHRIGFVRKGARVYFRLTITKIEMPNETLAAAVTKRPVDCLYVAGMARTVSGTHA